VRDTQLASAMPSLIQIASDERKHLETRGAQRRNVRARTKASSDDYSAKFTRNQARTHLTFLLLPARGRHDMLDAFPAEGCIKQHSNNAVKPTRAAS
jgi:hypothetical protein